MPVELLFTKPKLSDAKDAMTYINAFVDEKAQIATQSHKTLKEEKEWIKTLLKRMRKGDGATFFVREKNSKKLVATGGIDRDTGVGHSHIATIGISVRKEFRKKGIGSMLLKRLIAEGKKMKGIEIIHLNASSGNKDAIRLYEKHGFVTVARLPNWINHYGKKMDRLSMYYKGK